MDQEQRYVLGASWLILGPLATMYMYACYLGGGLLMLGSFCYLLIEPSRWWLALILFYIGSKLLMGAGNFWWEKYTGEYDKGPDLSFLVPPYIYDNLNAMQQGVYQPRHAAQVDVYGNPL